MQIVKAITWILKLVFNNFTKLIFSFEAPEQLPFLD